MVLSASVGAQTPSVFAVTSEFDQTFGFQYFFSRIHSGSGTVVHLSQLPVNAFYMGTAFINFDGNYMFVGKDTTNGMFNLYEVDTAGMVLGAIPATNSAGTSSDLLCVFQSRKCPFYYAIRWDSDALHELVKIDPVTGMATVMASRQIPAQMSQSTYAMDGDDRLFFLEASGITGYKTLFMADAATGTITATDSMPAPEHLFNLFYDCEADKIFGFYKNDGTFGIQGSEWIEIDPSGTIVHTGTFISGGGDFWISAFTTLANGDYFQKTEWDGTVQFNATSVSGQSFTPTNDPIASGDHKLYAAPPVSCDYTFECSDHTIGIATPEDAQHWQLFPNPASDQITLIISEDDPGWEYTMFDLSGRCIMSDRIADVQTIFDVRDLASGAYQLKLSSTEQMRVLSFVKN